jgi:class I fructose-bisphosphate aldolase
MQLGKKIRMNRLFSQASGRFFSVAFDHFIGYDLGLPEGLRTVKQSIDQMMAARPDAMTIHKGIAVSTWESHAGNIPLILQSVIGRLDIPHLQQSFNRKKRSC